jgi:tRNA (mo5U34)-methyltransferase
MNSLSFNDFFAALKKQNLQQWEDEFNKQLDSVLPRWLEAYDKLPDCLVSRLNLNSTAIEFEAEVDEGFRAELKKCLLDLRPWRKGPFNLFGVFIDSEWRSDFKWERIRPFLSNLKGRKILDIGCGNGYHMFRMLGEGARFVLGIDPSRLFMMQFRTLKRYSPGLAAFYLPLGIENLPDMPCFDTVFSMGVLYHRKSPFDFLKKLKSMLREGGELVLETLVVEGNEQSVLVPENRYAKMRNVWFIPSPPALKIWLKRAGFDEVRVVDVAKTTVKEQRATEWMQWESLPCFLDPENPDKTIEGYPAPLRATLIAKNSKK